MMHPEVCPMTVDRYTKTLLTIIAVCLLLQTMLALDKIVEARAEARLQSPYQQPGIAANAPQRVIIAGWDAGAIAKAQPLPVTIQQPQPVPVSLGTPVRLIYSQDDPLPVRVQDRKSLPE
jgi:hypothetical protein